MKSRSTRVCIALFVPTLVALGLGLAPTADAALPLRTKSCGDVVRSSFRLNNDLGTVGTPCPGHGLVVGRNGITIDLNGHTLFGSGVSHGISNAAGKDDVTIKNGTVQDFDEGVKIGDQGTNKIATANKVRNITATGNAEDGIDVDTGKGHKLINNTTSNNTEEGIEADMNRSVVRGNIVNDNGSGGTFEGIEVDGNRNIFQGNTANNNTDDGIEVTGNKNELIGNTALGNGDEGIHIDGGDRNIVKGTTTTSNNATHGVEISGDNNVVKFVQATNNGINGIFVESGIENRLVSNVGNTNGFATDDNIGLGIDAQVDNLVAGSGNTASGNDNPAECLPAHLCTV